MTGAFIVLPVVVGTYDPKSKHKTYTKNVCVNTSLILSIERCGENQTRIELMNEEAYTVEAKAVNVINELKTVCNFAYVKRDSS